ncbi:MAG: KH domain-containing protein [bacterium]|nr:KH domain-containing protein [bacterium]
MQDLLTYIAKSITGSDAIQIVEAEEDSPAGGQEGAKVYIIKAPQEFVGLLIGKEGKTVRAIRNLAKAKSMLARAKTGEESFEKVFVRVEEA